MDFISYFTFSIILYFIFVLGVTHVPNLSFAWIKKIFAWIKILHRLPAPSEVEHLVSYYSEKFLIRNIFDSNFFYPIKLYEYWEFIKLSWSRAEQYDQVSSWAMEEIQILFWGEIFISKLVTKKMCESSMAKMSSSLQINTVCWMCSGCPTVQLYWPGIVLCSPWHTLYHNYHIPAGWGHQQHRHEDQDRAHLHRQGGQEPSVRRKWGYLFPV